MRKLRVIAGFTLLAALLIMALPGSAQESVFALMKNDERMADNYFLLGNYQSALDLYKKSSRRKSVSDLDLKIARCYFGLKEFQHASTAFTTVIRNGGKLPANDLYKFAEALSAVGQYTDAIEVYRKYLALHPDDELVKRKVWRLNNIRYVFEDSAQYSLRSLSFNTASGELCAAPVQGGVVFLSNRKGIPVIENTDAALASPFYHAWFVEAKEDSLRPGLPLYTPPKSFSRNLDVKFHAGPMSFYDRGNRMVYTSTGEPSQSGHRSLELCFAELRNGKWFDTGKFPHNSKEHSNTDPFMTQDGRTLYFSSDRKGGAGGKDLYRSTMVNGKWSTPENLGEAINTRYDEVTPFVVRHQSLYFASDGHPGIGGLDIYRAEIENENFLEPQLIGYPLNTSSDEFGIFIDSTGTHGFISSNRKNGGFDDDVFEFEMDLQTYPLVISGQLRLKEHNWNDSSELTPFKNAKIELIDNIRNVTVFEGSSDVNGDFAITIPRFSNYRIRVVGQDEEDHVVSLEIPRQRKLYTNHEIVIVKDAFRSKNEGAK